MNDNLMIDATSSKFNDKNEAFFLENWRHREVKKELIFILIFIHLQIPKIQFPTNPSSFNTYFTFYKILPYTPTLLQYSLYLYGEFCSSI